MWELTLRALQEFRTGESPLHAPAESRIVSDRRLDRFAPNCSQAIGIAAANRAAFHNLFRAYQERHCRVRPAGRSTAGTAAYRGRGQHTA